jgi:type VI secretion system protein ImpF
VRRDLEWLLNTRCTTEPAPESLPETRRSLYQYGLPDISSMSADSADERALLVQHVQAAVELFEPRLSNVRVTLSESQEATERQVRFIIEATLHMDPEPEHVVFDTVLEVASAKFEVKGGSGA